MKTVEHEILERLSIDRALGELQPDVMALLDAYLEGEAGLSDEAKGMEETVRLAKLAMRPALPATLPELRPKLAIVVARGDQGASWQLPRWTWRMAACFAAGLMLGLLAMRNANIPVQSKQAFHIDTTMGPAAVESDFWSLSRFRLTMREGGLETDHRVVWISPVKQPEIKSSL